MFWYVSLNVDTSHLLALRAIPSKIGFLSLKKEEYYSFFYWQVQIVLTETKIVENFQHTSNTQVHVCLCFAGGWSGHAKIVENFQHTSNTQIHVYLFCRWML